MMREGETLQEYALRRTWLLVKSDIQDKDVRALKAYVDSLPDAELRQYIQIAKDLYDRRTLGARRLKVTPNAVKLCLKLAECGYHTFPIINKIATKGWDTAGGTYSFSITALSNGTDNEICSFDPVAKLIKSDAKLDIWYNENTSSTEVAYK